MRHLLVPALALVLVSGTASGAHGQQAKSAAGVSARLKQKPAAAWSRGMSTVGEPQTGSLGSEASARFSLHLVAGHSYAVAGLCDTDCHDLDLRLFDPEGTEVNADVESNDAPVVLVVPRRSGTYQVRAYMAECRADACTFGIQLYAR
jgi:hypothetical protein